MPCGAWLSKIFNIFAMTALRSLAEQGSQENSK